MTLLRRLWAHRPRSRGVTVYTGTTAEHFPTAHFWSRDDKGTLDVLSWRGNQMATFIDKTWFRVEAGPPRFASIETPTRNTE